MRLRKREVPADIVYRTTLLGHDADPYVPLLRSNGAALKAILEEIRRQNEILEKLVDRT